MADAWLYQYAVGGVVFLVGIGCGLATGQLAWRGAGGRRLLWLCAGLVAVAALQGAFVVWGK